MEILVISGLSGSGKSKVASFLEDIGYYIVDNLPAEMMVVFAEFCAASKGRYDRVALVYDVRTGEPAQKLIDALEQMKAAGIDDRYAMERGGWSCESTYRKTYSYVFDSDKADANKAINNYFADKITHKITHEESKG